MQTYAAVWMMTCGIFASLSAVSSVSSAECVWGMCAFVLAVFVRSANNALQTRADKYHTLLPKDFVT